MKLTNENPTPNDLAIFAAFEKWVDAHSRRDLDTLRSLTDPQVFSVGTGTDEVCSGAENLMKNFSRDFAESEHIILQTGGEVTVRSGDDWGWLFFLANFHIKVKGEDLNYPSRRTVLYRKEGGRWLQTHVHVSVPDRDQVPDRSYPVGPSTANWYMLLFTSSRDAVLVASRDSFRIIEANVAASKMYGIQEKDLNSYSLGDLMDEKELNLLVRHVDESLGKGSIFTSVHRDTKGRSIPVEINAACTEMDGRVVMLLTVRDITGRIEAEKALRLSEDRLRLATEFNEDLLWELDVPTMDIQFDGLGGHFGDRRTVPLVRWQKWIHPDDREMFQKALIDHLKGRDEFRVECRVLMPDGRWVWTLNRGRLADQDKEDSPRMIGTMMNIDRRKKIEEERTRLTKEIEIMASMDQLTGILNRQSFDRLLQERMEASKGESPFCLIMFDLDHFKEINDVSGHQKGDQVLKDVSRAVSRRLRSDDLFCRWGGDEFMVALETGMDRAKLVASDLCQVIEVSVDDGAFPVSASFGIASWDGNASISELTSRADEALYNAKRSGRNRVAVFGDNR